MQYFVKEPRVSVAIVNWNYQQYVADAIRSVKQQTYQNFHCAVLDNGSDDRSAEVIAAAIDGDPHFAFHRLPQNLGHLGGALWLLERLHDDFITFLDADDVLSPDYLATHLQAHLGALPAVAFTSSNCVDVDAAGSLLTGGNWWMAQSCKAGEPSMRPIDRTVRLDAIDDEAYRRIAEATRYLSPDTRYWRWCPGSSNMFRRALLVRVAPNPAAPALFGGVDGFFLPILHAISGSQLIDIPLSAYRVHGANDFSDLPSIRGVRSSAARADAQSNAIFISRMVSLIENIDLLLATIPAGRFWTVLDVVASTNPSLPIFVQPGVKSAFVKQSSRLRELFGSRGLVGQLHRRVSFRSCVEIAWADRNPRMLVWALVQELRKAVPFLRKRP